VVTVGVKQVRSTRLKQQLRSKGRAIYASGYAAGGLYDNIHAKRKRIAAGSGEKMRKPGTKGAPSAKAFKEAAKTAKGKK
jgi:hypothetical protein